MRLKYWTLIFVISITLASCEKDNEVRISIEDIHNLKLMDTNETPPDPYFDDAKDTVFYLFADNHKMTKIKLDYTIDNGEIALEKRDTVKRRYFLEKNSLFFSMHPDDELKILPFFGKDYTEWKILKLTSDTMIVDFYSTGGKRFITGHGGFSVL